MCRRKLPVIAVVATIVALVFRAGREADSSELANTGATDPGISTKAPDVQPGEADQEYFVFAAIEEQGNVDKFTGTFALQLVDLSIPAGATVLELTRSFGQEAETPGVLGGRWRLNWETVLVRDSDGARAIDASGVIEFLPVDAESTTLRSLTGEQLTPGQDNAVRFLVDGTEEVFLPTGKLAERRVRGSKFSVHYDADGRLDRIDGPEAASLVFTYAADGTIRVQASTGEAVTYSARGNLLSRVVRTRSEPTDYAYDPAGRLTKIEHPQFGSVELTYDPEGFLTARRWLDGSVERIDRPSPGTVRHLAPDGSLTVTEFDPAGRIATITDPAGRRSVLQFDRGGRISQVTDPEGKSIQFPHDENGRLMGVAGAETGPLVFQYRGDAKEPAGAVGPGGIGYTVKHDSSGRISQVQSRPGASASFQYDNQGRPTRIEASHAPALSLAYDKDGRVQSVGNAAGHAMHFERDSRGRVCGLVDFGGARTTWALDDQGRVTSETDAAGAVTRYEYSPGGLLRAVVEPNGATTRLAYHGRSITTTDPVGNKSVTWYDHAGRIERTTDPNGAEHRYEYDPAGNLVREVDESGGQTRYEYDARGRLVAFTAPDGNRTSYRYDESGRLQEITDLFGQRVVCEYDDGGTLQKTITAGRTQILWEVGPHGLRPRTLIPPEGPSARLGYDAHGNLVSVTGGDRTVIRRRYDELDRLIEESNDRGLTVRFVYDATGNLVGWSDSLGRKETTTYDPAGRPLADSGGLQGEMRFEYDLAGNLIEANDSLGHATRLSYDPVGRLAGIHCPSGREAVYEYDQAGRLAKARTGQGAVLQIDRDSGGNPVRLTDAAGRVTELRYDTAGRIVARTDAAGKTVSYVYSSAGMLLEKRLPDGQAVSYLYDARGNVTTVDDKVFPVRYSYDDRDRITRIEYPAIHRTLVRRYDPSSGRLAEFIDSEGRHFNYRYDDVGRLAGIETAVQGAFLFQYDAADRLVKMEYPNGIVGRWTYDQSDRLVGIVYQDSKGKVLDGVWCDYDKAGRPVLKRMLGDQVHYTYDPDDRLVEERGEGRGFVQYEYGPAGARSVVVREGTKTDIVSDAAGQLVSAGAARFEHDANGNLTARIENGLTTRYLYDAENRLVEVKLPRDKSVRFGYSPTGERVWREDEMGRTYYVTDGLHVWAELDADLKPTSLYAHGPMIDRPLMMTRGQQTFFYHSDELGSVTAISDGQGKLARRYRYDAFGNSREGRATGIDSPFHFTGREWDAAAQLYYFRSRYYDPQLGRFLSIDGAPISIGTPETLDAYAYVNNSPTRLVDPMGEQGAPPFPSTDTGMFQLVVEGGQKWLRDNPQPTFSPRQQLFRNSLRYSSHVTVEQPLAVAVNYPRNATPIRATTLSTVENAIRGAGGPLNPQTPEIWWRDHVHLGRPGQPSASSSLPRSVIEGRAPTVFRPRPGAGPRAPTVESPLTGTMPRPSGAAPTRLMRGPWPASPVGAGSGGAPLAGPSAMSNTIAGGISKAGFLTGSALSLIDIGDKVINDRPAGEIAGTVGFHAATHLLMGTTSSQIGTHLTAMVAAGSAPAWAPAALVAGGTLLLSTAMPATGTKLGELSVAYQQREQIENRRNALAAEIIENSDAVDKIAAQVADLESKKRSSEFFAMAAEGLASDARSRSALAEAALASMEALRPQGDLAATLGQVEATKLDAGALADQCEQLADQVVQRLASEAPGSGTIVDSQQVFALVSECNSKVQTIGGKVEDCRGRNESLGSQLAELGRGGDRLAQAEALLNQISTAVTQTDSLAEQIRDCVNKARGLRGEVFEKTPPLQRQIQRIAAQLTGVNVEGATAVHLRLSLLKERADTLVGFMLPINEGLPASVAPCVVTARLARSSAMAVLDELRLAVPTEMETADDAVARAEGAHQRALAALLAFLSRIRSAESADPATLTQTDGREQADEEMGLGDLGSMVGRPPESQSDPPNRSLDLLGQAAGPVTQNEAAQPQYSGEDITLDSILEMESQFVPPVGPQEPPPPDQPPPVIPPVEQRADGYEPVLVEGDLTASLRNQLAAQAGRAGGGASVQVSGSRVRLTINERGETGFSQGKVDCQLAEGGLSIREVVTINFQPQTISTIPGTMVPNRVDGVCTYQSRGVAFGQSASQGGTGSFVAARQANNSWVLTVTLPRPRNQGWIVNSLDWLLK